MISWRVLMYFILLLKIQGVTTFATERRLRNQNSDSLIMILISQKSLHPLSFIISPKNRRQKFNEAS